MVFVGYGVTAPERQWDDFKGVDLRGKVAVFLVNDPDFYGSAERAGRGQVRRPAHDVLRPLDLQVRGSRASRRDRGADRARHRRCRLRLADRDRAGRRELRSRSQESERARLRCRAGSKDRRRPTLFRSAGLDLDNCAGRRAARTSARSNSKDAQFAADVPVTATQMREPQRACEDDRQQASRRDDHVRGALGCLRRGAPDAQGRDDARGRERRRARGRRRARARASRSLRARGRNARWCSPRGPRRSGADRLAGLCRRTAVSAREDRRESDARHSANCRAGARRRAGRRRPEQISRTILRAPRRRRVAPSRPKRFPSADSSIAPITFRWRDAACPVLLLMAMSGGADLVEGGREAGNKWLDRLHALLSPAVRRVGRELGPARRRAGCRVVPRDRQANSPTRDAGRSGARTPSSTPSGWNPAQSAAERDALSCLRHRRLHSDSSSATHPASADPQPPRRCAPAGARRTPRRRRDSSPRSPRCA